MDVGARNTCNIYFDRLSNVLSPAGPVHGYYLVFHSRIGTKNRGAVSLLAFAFWLLPGFKPSAGTF
jgi:hypothetical protein